ncbi:MAG: CBS domain-containing protein [Terriglobia bacterium]
MDIPGKIRAAAQRLKEGHRVNRITVRDFLRHFGAERRGAVKVQEIREILDSLEIETDPDFETAWIDGPIWLLLKAGTQAEMISVATEVNSDSDDSGSEDLVLEATPAAVEQAEQQSESAPTSLEPEEPSPAQDRDGASFQDPTFRIGSLPAANKKLIAVNQGDTLLKAVSLMLQYDFSQLPVMQGEREVKGVVTWKSIGAKQAFGCKCLNVGDCREDARIVDSNRTLFDAIPIIVEYGYVLVRHRDRRITGIVTASDLSLQFQALAEPFLLLREIELHVRRLLQGKLITTDFGLLASPMQSSRRPSSIADLTFGEYVRLFQHPAIWAKLNLKVDSSVLTIMLDEVRTIRNDVMHFDPDPMTADELKTLKRASHFMQELFELLQQEASMLL